MEGANGFSQPWAKSHSGASHGWLTSTQAVWGNARPKQMVLPGRGAVTLLVDQDLLRLPALGELPEGRIA